MKTADRSARPRTTPSFFFFRRDSLQRIKAAKSVPADLAKKIRTLGTETTIGGKEAETLAVWLKPFLGIGRGERFWPFESAAGRQRRLEARRQREESSHSFSLAAVWNKRPVASAPALVVCRGSERAKAAQRETLRRLGLAAV